MLDNIDKYLEATCQFLGVIDQRYGGGFRAIICQEDNVNWLVSCLNGDDFEGTQTMGFFMDNALFPSASGNTASDALNELDRKLGILYDFIPTPEGVYKWKCHPVIALQAECDVAEGETPERYDVTWDDVVSDLAKEYRSGNTTFFYAEAKQQCGPRHYRDLHALISIVIPSEIESRLKGEGDSMAKEEQTIFQGCTGQRVNCNSFGEGKTFNRIAVSPSGGGMSFFLQRFPEEADPAQVRVIDVGRDYKGKWRHLADDDLKKKVRRRTRSRARYHRKMWFQS